MQGAVPATYKQLQDEVLTWMADGDDQGHLRMLVKMAIANHHERRLVNERWSFMLHPVPLALQIQAGVSVYGLHPAMLTPLYVRSTTTGLFWTEVPHDMLQDQMQRPVWPPLGAEGTINVRQPRFVLHGVLPVKAQPAAPGVVTVTNSGDTGKTITVFGDNASGDPVEETITLPNPGAVTFNTITGYRKNGTGWASDVTLAIGNTTLVTLGPNDYTRQYRQFRPLVAPIGSDVLEYQFYRSPRRPTEDTDFLSIPAPFDRITVLDALIDMQGYTRATQTEVENWREQRRLMEQDLSATYQDGWTQGAGQSYVNVVPRI